VQAVDWCGAWEKIAHDRDMCVCGHFRSNHQRSNPYACCSCACQGATWRET
jgi:hypothetical protein